MGASEREQSTPANMDASEREQSRRADMSVLWHDLECGAYDGDLELWRELAEPAEGTVLDLGCGTGRVALDLAARGRQTLGVDLDEEMVAALNGRAAEAGLPAEAAVGDARALALGRRFGLVIAPMQLLQVLGGTEERIACLRAAREHLAPGALLAAAVVDGIPPELVEDAPSPLPDTLERDGWVFSSLPLDADLIDGTIVVRRLRQAVSPDGEMSEELDEVPLRLLSAEAVEAEARAAGLEPVDRREIPPNDTHVGSAVVVMEAV